MAFTGGTPRLGAVSSIVETSSIAMLAAPIIALPSPSLSGSTRFEGRPNIGVSGSLELTPVSCSHKAGPVERMRALLPCAAIAQHAEAGFAHCVCGVEPLHEPAFVQRSHPDTSTPVLYLPEAHHDRSRSRHLERTSQPEHAFQARPARGPYRQSPAATNPAQKKGCPDAVADRRARKVESAAWWTASAVSRPRSKRAW